MAEGPTRDRVSSEVATLLARAVRLAARPLLVVALTPALLGVGHGLLAVGAAGFGRILLIVLAVLGVGAGAVLGWRRHELVAAVYPPEQLGAEVASALDVADGWSQAGALLTRLREEHGRRTGRLRHLRTLASSWRLSAGLRERLAVLDRIAPFLPPSLALTWACVLAAVVSSAVLAVTGAISVLLLALSSL